MGDHLFWDWWVPTIQIQTPTISTIQKSNWKVAGYLKIHTTDKEKPQITVNKCEIQYHCNGTAHYHRPLARWRKQIPCSLYILDNGVSDLIKRYRSTLIYPDITPIYLDIMRYIKKYPDMSSLRFILYKCLNILILTKN